MEDPMITGEVGRLINLMPVGLKEAALDSPTARASVYHFSEQVELFEKWLEEYNKSANRLLAESITLENIMTNFTSHALMPQSISESMMDHDYSVLAIKKYHDCAKDFWMGTASVIKRLNILVCEPIRQFQASEIRVFKDAKKAVDSTQKVYDTIQSKYAAQPKTTEPSSLREDAFQLHEARTKYLKAMMDFFMMVPQLRFSIDKFVTRMFHDQWREMRQTRENTAVIFQRSIHEMERIRGWTREMEDSERVFRRELVSARKQLEDAAELAARPPRDTEYYSIYTVGHAHTGPAPNSSLSPERKILSIGERQGWLFLRTWVRKPTRIVWVKRWAFVRNGVFGWLVQGSRPGTVEESERIGVLLCSVRPMPQEERRFCFELKTTKHTIGLQAETQAELSEWLSAIDTAKAKAVNDPASSEALTPGLTATDPAFTITAPPIIEFGTAVLASTEPETAGEPLTLDRSSTLTSLGPESPRDSEVLRRQTAMSSIDDGSRDHASKIMSKLDLHRRTPTGPQVSSPAASVGGGIASLIAASHGSMPVGPSLPMAHGDNSAVTKRPIFTLALRDMPQSSLAPSTLANIPAPTTWSKPAVVLAGERGIHGSRTNKNGVPNSILANTWGSSNGSNVHILGRAEVVAVPDGKLQPSPLLQPSTLAEAHRGRTLDKMDLTLPQAANRTRTPSPDFDRRQTFTIDRDKPKIKPMALPEYPTIYPIQLKTQDAQFRLLFPNVHSDERLVLVFRSTWNPNGQQEFPGRVYITTQDMYFYSNHLGLVLTAGVALSAIDEVTAAPGKDCDFLFMHLKEASRNGATRITIKVFLEPLRLLQNRLNFLAQNAVAEHPLTLEEVIRTLLRFESEPENRTPSLDSWEDVSLPPTNGTSGTNGRSRTNTADLKAPVRVDRGLWTGSRHAVTVPMFKLPAQPVKYVPSGYSHLAVAKQYDVSPKALFHVMFGDKSLLWQLLQHEREARNLKQGPWTSLGEGRLYRNFEFSIPTYNIFGTESLSTVKDYQLVDVNNDHLCYVVTDKRTPWHLPSQSRYRLISKIVITHVAKSKCQLSVYTKIEWLSNPWLLKNAIERIAISDLDLDAEDLADLVSDQVRKLGAHSRTKKAVSIFGLIGHSTDVTQLELNKSALSIETRRSPNRHTIMSLLGQDIASALESAITTILTTILDVARWLGKTCNANRVIVALLILSTLYNSWFVARDGYTWWQERSTIKFLKRVGIGPDAVMSKAVYVEDLHEAMSAQGVFPTQESSACFQVFRDESRSLEVASSPSSAAKQRLGLYRHNLLVAMRVVNSIEQELVRSEWERWVTDENSRCHATQSIVDELMTGNETQSDARQIKDWYDDYCSSCTEEFSRITRAG